MYILSVIHGLKTCPKDMASRGKTRFYSQTCTLHMLEPGTRVVLLKDVLPVLEMQEEMTGNCLHSTA